MGAIGGRTFASRAFDDVAFSGGIIAGGVFDGEIISGGVINCVPFDGVAIEMNRAAGLKHSHAGHNFALPPNINASLPLYSIIVYSTSKI